MAACCVCGDRKVSKGEMPRAFKLAQGIENQVIREMVCSKVSWHLDRDFPLCRWVTAVAELERKLGGPCPGCRWKSQTGSEHQAGLFVAFCLSLDLCFLNLFSAWAH